MKLNLIYLYNGNLHSKPVGKPSHLFEDEDTVSRADELRQLGDASLVEVGPREAAVVEVYLGTAVFAVPMSCTGIQR